MDAVFFPSGREWREWLRNNHDRAAELLLGFFKKGSGRGGITYAEALDEALCLGWIDGVRRGRDEESYTIRFTPRKAVSIWSEVNRKRIGELIAEERVETPGMAAFARADRVAARRYSYENAERELSAEFGERLRANRAAWEFFRGQAPSYQRVAKYWVMSAKKEETRVRRLALLIEDSANGLRLAQYTLEKREKRR